MKNKILFIAIAVTFSSCSFIEKVFDYKKLCNETVDNLMAEKYDDVLSNFSYDRNDTAVINRLTKGVREFRVAIVKNLGTEIKQHFISATKKFSTTGDEPDVTKISIQIEGKGFYGVLVFTIDDRNGKIDLMHLNDEIKQIPNTTWFWMFSILPLLVLLFNIYTIRKILRSDLKRKWAYVLLCILINFPALVCNVEWPNMFINIELAFQMLFGVGINLMGYDNYMLSFGFPIGSLTALFVLYRRRKKLLPASH